METSRATLLSRIHLIAATALIAAVVLYVLGSLYLVANPGTQTLRIDENGARGGFRAERTTVMLPGDCITVRWAVDGARGAFIRELYSGTSGANEICGAPLTLTVAFQNGTQKTYTIDKRVLIAPPLLPLLLLALVGLAAWQWASMTARVKRSPGDYAVRTRYVLWGALFEPDATSRLRRLLVVFGLLALFAFGVDRFIDFYNNGTVDVNRHDWARASGYNNVIAEAFKTGQLPIFTSGAINITDRLMGNPEVPLAPDIILIPLLTPGQYALAHTLLFYAVGFIGLLLIRRRYRWSLATFAAFFLIFNFNGHLISHLTVGHAMWNSYFLLSFFALFTFQMIDGEHPRRDGLLIGLTLFGLALGGGVHLFIFCLLTLFLLGVCSPRLLLPCLIAIAAGGLLSAARFLPAAVAASGYAPDFIGGYAELADLLRRMMTFDPALFTSQATLNVRYRTMQPWELDAYVSLIGTLFLGVFGLARQFWRGNRPDEPSYRELNIPIGLMTLFAVGSFYSPIFNLGLPLLDSERVTARFIIIPIVLLLMLACIRFERWLPRLAGNHYGRLLTLGALLLMAQALGEHMHLWRVFNFERLWPVTGNVPTGVQIIPFAVQTLTGIDRTYVYALGVGALISLAAFVAWIWLYRRWRETPPPVIVLEQENALTPAPSPSGRGEKDTETRQ